LKRKLTLPHPNTIIMKFLLLIDRYEERHGPAAIVYPVFIPRYYLGFKCKSLCVFYH